MNYARPVYSKRWISKTYTQWAEGWPCVICGVNDETVVACHLPHTGYGMPAGTGGKTHDWLTAHCCRKCHDKLDSGEWRNDYQIRMKAFCATLQRAFDAQVFDVFGS